jgi:tetratricopeptide (TPR) repeat protein
MSEWIIRQRQDAKRQTNEKYPCFSCSGYLPRCGSNDVAFVNSPSTRARVGIASLLIVGILIHPASAMARQLDQHVRNSADARTSEVNPGSSVERDYQALLRVDDGAQQEVEELARRADEAKSRGDTLLAADLNEKVRRRLSSVRAAYDVFLRKHSKHALARIAFGNFLFQIGEEEDAVKQWTRASRLDPKNPDPWNNLAHYYQHRGPVKKAFRDYTKATKLNPDEPVFLRNLANAIYVYRKDAMEYYGISEREVFDKAIQLYRQALKLDPKNFQLAVELAEAFYLIKPLRTTEALQAWNGALMLVDDDFEREGVYLHMARVELNSGMLDEGREHLNLVTNEVYNPIKTRLVRKLENKTSDAGNSPTATAKSPNVQ